MTLRVRPATALLAAACLTAMATATAAPAATLAYLGQQIVESGFQYAGTTVGGLSSIDYDAADGRYLAISDDRSTLNPARFYSLRLDLSKFARSATPGRAGVAFDGVTTILTPAGTPFGPSQVDPESLRLDAGRHTLYWGNEGQRTTAGFQNPTVREMSLDGGYVRDFSVPGRYAPGGSAAGTSPGDRGVYNNLAFESLTLSQDKKTLWTATENALAQDGPMSSVSNGSPSRLLSFDIASGASKAEYVYDVAPVALAPQPAGGFATNGLTDILSVGEGQFITVERSFATGAVTPGTPTTGNTIRLYLADVRGATDVSGLDSIVGENVVAAKKTLLLDLSTLHNDDGSALALDNIEGITFGPEVDGRRTLVLISDNNFSGTQFTQFVALSLTAVPEPETYALMLGGLGAVGWVARRRRLTR